MVVYIWYGLVPLDPCQLASGKRRRIGDCNIVGVDVSALLTFRTSRAFAARGRTEPLRRLTVPSVIHCHQHCATAILLRPTCWLIPDTSVRPARFSEAHHATPFEAGQLFVLALSSTRIKTFLSYPVHQQWQFSSNYP